MILRSSPNPVIFQGLPNNPCLTKPYVTATQTFPYVMNEHKYKKNTKAPEFILKKGIVFEEDIVNELKKRYQVVKVAEKVTFDTFQMTQKYIQEKVSILYQVPLINPCNNTKGIADLVIHRDVLSSLLGTPPPNDSLYYVIDLKFKTIKFNKDKSISNAGYNKAYKVQLKIYIDALNFILGDTSSQVGYVLGRRYLQESNKYINPLYTLGEVNFKTFDIKWSQISKDAIQYYRSKLHSSPPVLPENDITNVWKCGSKHRDTLLQNIGTTEWTDEKCNSQTLGINPDSKTGHIIDCILKINRQNKDNIYPSKIMGYTYPEWRDTSVCEAFLDTETLLDIYYNDVNHQHSTNTIFMYGILIREVSGKETYHSYVLRDLENEHDLINDIEHVIEKYKIKRIWYWHAEDRIIKNFFKRHSLQNNEKITSILKDMYKLFVNEPIVLKGALNFKLKTIVKTMNTHQMISLSYDTDVQDGLTAAHEIRKMFDTTVDEDVLEDVKRYNEIDTKVLYHILSYLRNNH